MMEETDRNSEERQNQRVIIAATQNQSPTPDWTSDWQLQFDRITGLLSIARITILFSLLIFLAVLHNIGGSVKIPTYLPMVHNERLLHIWCIVYGIVIMFGMAKPQWQYQRRGNLPNFSAVIDITMMGALTYLAGGVASGFGILLLPFLATSCLLSYGRYPMLYGSYAALLVAVDIVLCFWPFTREQVNGNLNLLTDQIILMGACYLVPLITAATARYVAGADQTVRSHRIAFERISGLNRIVLNRMQEAVIVVDSARYVWMHNQKAKAYLPELRAGIYAVILDPVIQLWRRRPNHEFETVMDFNGQNMIVRAVPLHQADTDLLMLFIRSEEERKSEAQAVKLASLGLLTANLAHELRNPLSAIRQANGILEEGVDSQADPSAPRLLRIIEKNVSRIDRMVEDISVLNKRDRVNTETIHVMKFWLQFSQEFYLTHPEAQGCLKMDMPPQYLLFQADSVHVQQIITNLVNNAWRHSSRQKDAVIISARALNEERIAIRVWDDGPGVAEHILEHLFEPFNSSETENKGTGLGLYVARELAHANRGDLQYIRAAKCFELILPRVMP